MSKRNLSGMSLTCTPKSSFPSVTYSSPQPSCPFPSSSPAFPTGASHIPRRLMTQTGTLSMISSHSPPHPSGLQTEHFSFGNVSTSNLCSPVSRSPAQPDNPFNSVDWQHSPPQSPSFQIFPCFIFFLSLHWFPDLTF